ncbi:MAG TPA: two-component regulator propeller domain-containing protein, partial [Bacteroidota bacterium]|nr:two-component regulator propeller domain-containing protein [Bacteroidota bacterium]
MYDSAKIKYKHTLAHALFWVFVVVANPTFCRSQQLPPRFEHLSVNDGLSQSTVLCITQDHKGFMWFGTADGLNKYDGYGMTVYRHDDQDSTTLTNSVVRVVFEDHEGTLWVGTDAGLNRLDREQGKFSRFGNDARIHFYIGTLQTIDEMDGALWVGGSSGLYRLVRSTGTLTRYPYSNDPQGVYSNSITATCRYQSGRLLVGSMDGLKTIDTINTTINDVHLPKEASSLAHGKILSLFRDRLGEYWVSTANFGVWRFDSTFQHGQRCDVDPNEERLRSLTIKTINEDGEGRLWLGSYARGFYVYDRDVNTFMNYRHDVRNPSSLGFDLVLVTYRGASGMFWVGTDGGGVNILKPYAKPFLVYRNDPLDPNSLNCDVVKPITEDRNGMVWVGTVGGGLNRLDRLKNQWTHFQHNPSDPNSLSSNIVTALCPGPRGGFWIGMPTQLDFLPPRKSSFTHVHLRGGDSLAWTNTQCLFFQDSSHLWIGAATGVAILDLRQNSSAAIPFRTPGGSTASIYTIERTADGSIWLGGEGVGLARYDSKLDRIVFVNHLSEPAASIRCIHEARDHVLWIGTEQGLVKFNPRSAIVSWFGKEEGLANEFIYGILEDRQGNLWLSTNKGLSRFTEKSPPGSQFKNYDVSDGLQGNEFDTGAFFESEGGEMLFGGVNGFNIFHPDSIKDNPFRPQVVITNIRKFEESIANEGTLERSSSFKTLFKENVITFDFVALEYTNPTKNRYAYMMQNFDKEWVDAGTQRFARYTNLDPGEYIFRVKATNNDGVWNEGGASVVLVVVPPYWRTWWFMTAAGILVFSTIVGTVRVFSWRKLQRELRRLEAEQALLN